MIRVLKSAATSPGLLLFSAGAAALRQWQGLAYVKSFIHLLDKIDSPSTSPENIRRVHFIDAEIKGHVARYTSRWPANEWTQRQTEELDAPLIK